MIGKALLPGLLAVALLGTAACGAAESPGAGTRTDEAAVLDLMNRYVAAWNAGDGQAFGAAYAPEATHVTFDGALLRGRTEIAGVHSQLFGTFLRGSRIELQVEDLRLVTDDVAVLHTSGGILEAGDTALSADRRSMNTMIAAKHADGWALTTVQVTRIA
ncbi:SgcJ/EcaC family oxidoreductase [Saccharopolyspora indica]|uniref:SgcJ/EcaC family oxidoreductase n=1 Tax=Saccharopolyspora indica TaxID=1229659 RepID=UPI0022EB5664|nr:SgcJ/EcaC family oxidoreductase [Saccharopolyspora indica]MDA3648834.1 SgcJ/EcaC family oxidoreductase [Saccharopolyspora indica]